MKMHKILAGTSKTISIPWEARIPLTCIEFMCKDPKEIVLDSVSDKRKHHFTCAISLNYLPKSRVITPSFITVDFFLSIPQPEPNTLKIVLRNIGYNDQDVAVILRG